MLIYQNIRRLCTISANKFVQATVLGADTATGEGLGFFLKQNPSISVLHLQGCSDKTEGLGADLSHMNTKSLVYSYHGENSVRNAIRSTNMIFLLGTQTKYTKIGETIMNEGERFHKITELCAKYAPKALLIVCVYPVSVFTPLAMKIYKKSPWYHPSRIIGATALPQIKANTITGNFLNLDPQGVYVPLLGGPDLDCCIPLLSRTDPVNITGKYAKNLWDTFKEKHDDLWIGEAFGLNKLATCIVAGINNDNENAKCNAFVRSNIINTCQHLVTSVKFGNDGSVEHNYGIPQLIRTELELFEKATLILKERQQMADEFLEYIETEKQPPFLIREKEEEEVFKSGIVR